MDLIYEMNIPQKCCCSVEESHQDAEMAEVKQEQFREGFFVCSSFKCFTLVQTLLENTFLGVGLFLLLKKM